jgi:hypothetical protein
VEEVMSDASAIERLDAFIKQTEDWLAELRSRRAEMVVLDQARNELASVNAEISAHREVLAELKQVVAEAWAHMSRKAA